MFFLEGLGILNILFFYFLISQTSSHSTFYENFLKKISPPYELSYKLFIRLYDEVIEFADDLPNVIILF